MGGKPNPIGHDIKRIRVMLRHKFKRIPVVGAALSDFVAPSSQAKRTSLWSNKDEEDEPQDESQLSEAELEKEKPSKVELLRRLVGMEQDQRSLLGTLEVLTKRCRDEAMELVEAQMKDAEEKMKAAGGVGAAGNGGSKKTSEVDANLNKILG